MKYVYLIRDFYYFTMYCGICSNFLEIWKNCVYIYCNNNISHMHFIQPKMQYFVLN